MTHIKSFKNIRPMLPAIAVAAGLFFGAAPEAKANSQQISCPVSKVKREITTSLPSGWWNTPLIISLKETKVISIGGKKALQCRYGAAGNIQRYAPTGQICTAKTGGFKCSPILIGTVTPTFPFAPQTHKTGQLIIKQTYSADFDNGLVTSSGADIWFQAVNSSTFLITPRNGAKMAIGDRSNRGYAGCRNASYSSSRVRLSDIPVDSYVCVKTSQGRISQFRMNQKIGGIQRKLKIGYTTWK